MSKFNTTAVRMQDLKDSDDAEDDHTYDDVDELGEEINNGSTGTCSSPSPSLNSACADSAGTPTSDRASYKMNKDSSSSALNSTSLLLEEIQSIILAPTDKAYLERLARKHRGDKKTFGKLPLKDNYQNDADDKTTPPVEKRLSGAGVEQEDNCESSSKSSSIFDECNYQLFNEHVKSRALSANMQQLLLAARKRYLIRRALEAERNFFPHHQINRNESFESADFGHGGSSIKASSSFSSSPPPQQKPTHQQQPAAQSQQPQRASRDSTDQQPQQYSSGTRQDPPPPGPPPSSGSSRGSQRQATNYTSDRLVAFFFEYWFYIFTAIVFSSLYPEPGFFAGILVGVYLVVLAAYTFVRICMPIDRTPVDEMMMAMGQGPTIPVDKAILGPTISGDQTAEDVIIYKGWMNLLRHHYDPRTFSITSTRSALVRLDRDVIRISLPKVNIGKHSFWNENVSDPPFVSQELFSLAGAKIVLKPKNLARRRWWSRKYPICIYVYRHATIKGVRHALSDTNAPKSSNISTESESGDNDDENHNEWKTAALKKPARPASTSDLQGEGTLHSTDKHKKSGTHGQHESGRRKKLYLFARSPREKEQWFHKIKKAISQLSYKKEVGVGSRGAYSDEGRTGGRTEQHQQSLDWILYDSLHKQFLQSMRAASVQEIPSPVDALLHNMQLNSHQWKNNEKAEDRQMMHEENIVWLNALFSRIFLDFSNDQNWIYVVQHNIERKLASIHLPYFIESLKLSRLEPGFTTPRIVGVYEPYVNEWGLWFDFNVIYQGDFRLALETKVNLMKLKTDKRPPHLREQITKYWDDEIPESPESSEDEAASKVPEPPKNQKNKPEGPRETKSRKLLNLVDRITNSKYFQEATENKFVKKIMKGVSETAITLVVDVNQLEGSLAINIPPPPSDRLWYGFRSPPKVQLKARPKLGERAVNLSQVTEFIENKLVAALEKTIVLPNMDDFVIPLMSGNPLLFNINV